jgi:hypothetical protein
MTKPWITKQILTWMIVTFVTTVEVWCVAMGAKKHIMPVVSMLMRTLFLISCMGHAVSPSSPTLDQNAEPAPLTTVAALATLDQNAEPAPLTTVAALATLDQKEDVEEVKVLRMLWTTWEESCPLG